MRIQYAAVVLLLLGGWQAIAQTGDTQQIADPNFKPTVRGRAYSDTHPVVVVDEAHENFHTVGGRYKPFADVLRADGYLVVAGTRAFTKATLGSAVVLVISNAIGSGLNQSNASNPPSAFTDAECDAVRDWVQGGGSLLLIADHAPFGATAATLAARFGVEMGKGYVWTVQGNTPEPTMTITYARDNALVGEHPITRGVSRVVTFTGQSLSVPPGATALLKLDTAYESAGANAQSDVASFREGKPTLARTITNRGPGRRLRIRQRPRCHDRRGRDVFSAGHPIHRSAGTHDRVENAHERPWQRQPAVSRQHPPLAHAPRQLAGWCDLDLCRCEPDPCRCDRDRGRCDSRSHRLTSAPIAPTTVSPDRTD